MWFMISTFNFVSLWTLITAIYLHINYKTGKRCYIFYKGLNNENVMLENSTTIISRCITYVFWIIPLVYVFWPADKTCFNSKDIRESFGSEDQRVTLLDENINYGDYACSGQKNTNFGQMCDEEPYNRKEMGKSGESLLTMLESDTNNYNKQNNDR